MQALIDFLNSTDINAYIQNNAWVWPTMEMIHFAGLCLLLGSLLIIDLSVIGFAPNIPLKVVDKFIIATLIGFTLNAITGGLFFIGDPDRYAVNIAFRIKIVFIALAGLNALYFTFRVRPQIQAGANNFTELGFNARLSTAISLTLWTTIIVLGRFIPYVEEL